MRTIAETASVRSQPLSSLRSTNRTSTESPQANSNKNRATPILGNTASVSLYSP